MHLWATITCIYKKLSIRFCFSRYMHTAYRCRNRRGTGGMHMPPPNSLRATKRASLSNVALCASVNHSRPRRCADGSRGSLYVSYIKGEWYV